MLEYPDPMPFTIAPASGLELRGQRHGRAKTREAFEYFLPILGGSGDSLWSCQAWDE